MREELTRTDDPQRLLGFARRWLYDHRLIIVHERRLRAMIATARSSAPDSAAAATGANPACARSASGSRNAAASVGKPSRR
jgi:hypothetical protein